MDKTGFVWHAESAKPEKETCAHVCPSQDPPASGDEIVETVVANIREGGICDHFRRMFNSMCCLLALIIVDEACLFHQVSRRISQQPRCGEGLESSPALILHELCRTEQARAGKLRDFAVLEK